MATNKATSHKEWGYYFKNQSDEISAKRSFQQRSDRRKLVTKISWGKVLEGPACVKGNEEAKVAEK